MVLGKNLTRFQRRRAAITAIHAQHTIQRSPDEDNSCPWPQALLISSCRSYGNSFRDGNASTRIIFQTGSATCSQILGRIPSQPSAGSSLEFEISGALFDRFYPDSLTPHMISGPPTSLCMSLVPSPSVTGDLPGLWGTWGLVPHARILSHAWESVSLKGHT